MTTTRSIISNFRATPRLFPVPVSSPLRQTEILRLANYHRPISSTSSSSSPSGNSQNQTTNTRSDRLLVLGLLTFTTLIGVGIGTRAKCYQNGTVTSNNESKNSSKTLSQNQSGNSSETKSDNSPETPSETSEQGAFNPETGEINWDCPCLGGMAHGTCGEQFKAAFSCFVHSEQEPKGVECIERFKEMQDCFREHPDEYGPELTDSDDSARDDEPPNSLDEIAPEDQLHVEGQTEERQLAARPLTPEDAPIQNENRTEERQETNEEVVESSKKQAQN